MKETKLEICRETAMTIWKKKYGKATEAIDFAGRKMYKGAYNQRGSEYGWNLDHILPKSQGGKDTESNLICTHILTNDEKADKYPVFTANGKIFEIVKVENHYEIREKSAPKKVTPAATRPGTETSGTDAKREPTVELTHKLAMALWKKQFGSEVTVTDFSGRKIDKGAYGQKGSKCGWSVTHILPKKHGGADVESNLICAHILTIAEKADSFPCFTANGKHFEIVKVGDRYEINEKKPTKNTSNTTESNSSATEKTEDAGVNFFDSAAGIRCYNNHDKAFWGSVTVELHIPASAAILDFIKDIFDGEAMECESYGSAVMNTQILTVRVTQVRLSTTTDIQNLLDNCVTLNTYLKYYFLRKGLVKKYTIFCEAHTQKEELRRFTLGDKQNRHGYLRNKENLLLVNERIRYNTDAKDNRSENQSTNTDSLGIKVYEYDYWWIKLKENLEKK